MTADLTLRTETSALAVPRAAWDALLSPGDSPFVRHDFIATLEETGCASPETGWQPMHLLAYRGEKLVGATPLYVKGHMMGEFVFDHAFERFAERQGVRYYPKLVAAVPFTPATGARLLVAPAEDRATVARALARGVHAVAHKLGLSSAHVLFASGRDRDLLIGEGYAHRVGVQFHWQNRGYATYDDFLATFNAKRRHQLRRERREVEKMGISVRTLRGREIDEQTLDFVEKFYMAGVERHFPWGRAYLNRRFFERIAERMPESIEVVVASEQGRPIAGCFNVASETTLYGRYWGALEQRPFMHFQVCYYHSIEDCIARKLSAFEPGAGGEHKAPRGFEPTLTSSLHTFTSPKIDGPIRRFIDDERAAITRELSAEQGED